jgi:hypothetical protein
MSRNHPNPINQERTKKTGKNRCDNCGNNFSTPDELDRHIRQTHPQSKRQESGERENVPVE